MKSIDQLGTMAAEIAMRSAAEYIRVNNLKVLDWDAATECLRSWCKIKLPEALRDATEAIDAGMVEAGDMTFRLTMAQAGIEAAKEFAWPMDYQPA